MSGLGALMLCSVIQVTMLATVALAFERLASWRGPRAGSWAAAAGIVILLFVGPLPFFVRPLAVKLPARAAALEGDMPGRSINPPNHDQGTPRPAAAVGGAGLSIAMSAESIVRLASKLAVRTETWAGRDERIARACGVIALGGIALSVFRLLIGLSGVRDCRRRGVPLTDPDVVSLVTTFRRELGIKAKVEIRTLPASPLATPAAVGWRRPMILLPHHWREWSADERGAVLAHELAHVARGDFLLGFLARVGLSVHFYHPIVHWLATRLRLQQELAADEMATRLIGSRRSYLVSLSRLALSREETLPAWPASAFLSSRGHLIRRIQMLNSQVPTSSGSLSIVNRVLVVAVLTAIGVGVAALRVSASGPAAEVMEEKPGADVARRAATVAKQPAFDLSFIPDNSQGFFAVRPAAFFQLPGMKPYQDALNSRLAKISLRAEMIEQMTAGITITPRDLKAGKQGRIAFGAVMVRTVVDFDWKKFIAELAIPGSPPQLLEVPFEGATYYKTSKGSWYGPAGTTFYFPDARTMVQLDEPRIQRLIRVKNRKEFPICTRGSDWARVESALVAVVIDNHDGRLRLDAEAESPNDLRIAKALQSAGRWIIGIDGGEALVVRGFATCGDGEKAAAVAKELESVIDHAKADLLRVRDHSASGIPEPVQRARATAIELATKLLNLCEIKRDGHVVEASIVRKLSTDELQTILFSFF
jgi:beta-lactamase regulating signal transducer with metallopeptidase domain